MEILWAVLVLGGLGVLLGLGLGMASKVFKVDRDIRIQKIMETLPCANCGGCGFAGCSAFATAVVEKGADPAACTVGGAECAAKVSEIMGVESVYERKTARVKCVGDCEHAPVKFEYHGLENCESVNKVAGGSKVCAYGCLGLGSCVQACDYHAISIVNGVAQVDESKCYGCGQCAVACPRHLIEVIPVKKKYYVACTNQDKGAFMKDTCSIGCIGCKLCERVCESGAITVENNLAKIDYTKCTVCGKCAEKCPKKVIRLLEATA